jgi:hypothetical protein
MEKHLNKLYITRVTEDVYKEIERLRTEIGMSKSGITRYLLFCGIQNVKNNLCM